MVATNHVIHGRRTLPLIGHFGLRSRRSSSTEPALPHERRQEPQSLMESSATNGSVDIRASNIYRRLVFEQATTLQAA